MLAFEKTIGIAKTSAREFRKLVSENLRGISFRDLSRTMSNPEMASRWQFGIEDGAINYRDADIVVLLGSRTDQPPATDAAIDERVRQVARIYEYSQCQRVVVIADGDAANGIGEIARLSEKLLTFRDHGLNYNIPLEKLWLSGTGDDGELSADRMYVALARSLNRYQSENAGRQPVVIVVGEFYNLPRLRLRMIQEDRYVFGYPAGFKLMPQVKKMLSEVLPYWKNYLQVMN